MKQAFLGDSYDAVKRLWQELFADWAPLYADSRFIPKEIRSDFEKLTKISMLEDHPPSYYSILNDPCTGIRLPSSEIQSEGQKHVSIETIIMQINNGAQCVVTFDQRIYRNIGMDPKEQRQAKMMRLSEDGCQSFYYVSHAPFLFAFPDKQALKKVEGILTSEGIPQNRLEKIS
jgi:hypothetical protein